ncbi:MAG: GNAT family N-acetyltransferase [Rubripirellula sp.]
MSQAPFEPPFRNFGCQLVEALTDQQVEQLLSLLQQQWWGRQRTLEQVQRMLENTSLILGVVDSNSDQLVAFCRVLTDFAFRATIYDVMVDKGWQGRGLGDALMQQLCDDPRLKQVSLIYLCCEETLVPFYERRGFSAYSGRAQWMIKVQQKEEE